MPCPICGHTPVLGCTSPLVFSMLLLMRQLVASHILLQLLTALPRGCCLPASCIYLLQGLGNYTSHKPQAGSR
jgi:hypothetical protein